MEAAESPSALVSVILATYKRPHYLRLALASALAGTYRNIEVIVSDNSNLAENRAIAASFGDPRVRYRANPTNIGVAANYFAAFREMKGKYFAVLGDDDLWGHDYLERLVSKLETNPRVVVAFSDHYVIDAEGNVDAEGTEREHRYYRHDMLREGISYPLALLGLAWISIHWFAAAVIRTRAIDFSYFPLEVGHAIDLWVAYLAARSGGEAYYVPEKLIRYRVHPGSNSRLGFAERSSERAFVFSRVLRDGMFPEYRDRLRRNLSISHLDCGAALLKTGRLLDASRHLLLGMASPGGTLRLAHLLRQVATRRAVRQHTLRASHSTTPGPAATK